MQEELKDRTQLVLNVAMNSKCRMTAVWCRLVVKCTTWYNSGDMKLWYVVQGKETPEP
jgi:hypothetical protein